MLGGSIGMLSLLSGAANGYQQGQERQHDWDRQASLDKIRTDEAARVADDWSRVNGMRKTLAAAAAPVTADPVDGAPQAVPTAPAGPTAAAVAAGMSAGSAPQDTPPPRSFMSPPTQTPIGDYRPAVSAPVQSPSLPPAMPSAGPGPQPLPAAVQQQGGQPLPVNATPAQLAAPRMFKVNGQVVAEPDLQNALAQANSPEGVYRRQAVAYRLQGDTANALAADNEADRLHSTAALAQRENVSHIIEQNIGEAPSPEEIKAAKSPILSPLHGIATFNASGDMRLPEGSQKVWFVNKPKNGDEFVDFKIVTPDGTVLQNSAHHLNDLMTLSAKERQEAADKQYTEGVKIKHDDALLAETVRDHTMTDATSRANNAATVGASISNNRANIAKDYAVAGLNADGSPNNANEALIDGIGKGMIPAPNAMALRSAKGQQLMAAVTAKYPNFDATAYGARQGAVKSFATGKDGQAIQAGNTALNHVETVEQLATALNNGNIPLFNSIANRLAQETGQPAPTNLKAAITMVAPEITKAVVGASGGVGDRAHTAATLDPNASPAQILGSIGTIKDIFGGRLTEAARTYKRTTGYDDFSDKFLSPAAQRIYAARSAAHSADTAAPATATAAMPADIQALLAKHGTK